MGRLQGVYTALVTPFGRSGVLRLREVPTLLEFQRKAGVEGVVVGGTNGEGVSLSVTERKRLLETVLASKGDLEVIAATGASALPDAVALTRHATRCGVDAVLVLPPFYYKNVTLEGVATYFRAVAAAAGVPMILYSIPQFSCVPINLPLMERLRTVPGIVGVKESSPETRLCMSFLRERPDLKIFVGNDLYLAELLQAGACGVISGTANAFPELIVDVARAVKEGGDAQAAQQRLNSAISVLSEYPIVGAAKTVLETRHVARLGVRAPLVMPDARGRRTMLRNLRKLGVL